MKDAQKASPPGKKRKFKKFPPKAKKKPVEE
jgi:hypothetical protein